MKVSVNTAIFVDHLNNGESQIACLKKITNLKAKIDNIQVRGEFFKDESKDAEIEEIKKLCHKNGWGLYYSVPEQFFVDGHVNVSLEDNVAMAKKHQLKHLKYFVGDASQVDPAEINKAAVLLAKVGVDLTLENLSNETGHLAVVKEGLKAVTKYDQIGFTYDAGNWYWVDEKPETAFNDLKDQITNYHLKDIKNKETVMLGDGTTDWKKMILELDPQIPIFLEYGIPDEQIEHELDKVNAVIDKRQVILMTYLVQLFVILFLTKIAAHFSVKAKMPSVIGSLLVGIIIGPAILNVIKPTTFINYFSQLGVIVLMFIAGLEGDLKLLIKYWAPALTVATLGVIFPTGTAYVLCHYGFGYSNQASIFMGLVLSATSVSITIQVLKEMGRLNTREGAIICGAAVADDIICVILLGICSSIYGGGQHKSIIGMVIPMILFFIIILLIGKYVVPKFMDIFTELNATESDTAGAMILCFGAAALAVAMGMSDVLGAYFAGLAISETDSSDRLANKIEPIGYAVFIPVFFVSIGLQISFAGMGKDLVFIILLIIIAILGKQVGCSIGAKMFKLNWTESNIVGAGMVSRGEMALVVANVAIQSHLIDQNHYTAMIVVTVITTLIAPLILKLFIQKAQKRREKSIQFFTVKLKKRN